MRKGRTTTRAASAAAARRPKLVAGTRAAIDAEFAGMAKDAGYQREAIAICEEFALADAEAFRLAEELR